MSDYRSFKYDGDCYGYEARGNESLRPNDRMHSTEQNQSKTLVTFIGERNAPQEIKGLQNLAIRDNTNNLETGDNNLRSQLASPTNMVVPEEMDRPIDNTNQRKLVIASVLCLVFMIGEAVGGVVANSLAVLTDSAHLLTDFAAFMISLFSIHVATRQPSKMYSFGWQRAEIIGALMSIMLLWLVTGILVFCAIERLADQDFHIKPKIMLLTSGLGLLINLVMAMILYYYKPGGLHGHSHMGGGGHSHDLSKGNVNIRAAIIHVFGDMIQSMGVMIAAIIVYVHPKAKIVDPLCTFFFSGIVMFSTVTVLKDIFGVLMEGVPKGLQYNNVFTSLTEIPGIEAVHNLRLWSLSLDKQAVAVHLVSDGTRSMRDLLLESQKMLQEEYGLYEATIQIEQIGGSSCQNWNDIPLSP